MRDEASLLTNKPNAWLEFIEWHQYHRDNIANAALAYYMSEGPGTEKDNIYSITVIYIPDLPVERKFVFFGSRFASREDCNRPGEKGVPAPMTMAYMMEEREAVEHNLQSRLSDTSQRVRVGAYHIALVFDTDYGPGANQVHSYFPITDEQYKSELNTYLMPFEILRRMLYKGLN